MSHGELTNPEGFARTVLTHAVNHGDLIGHDDAGNAVVALTLPPAALDALAAFDPDGDPDTEQQCEDEGAQDEREPETDKGVEDEGEPNFTRIYGGGSRDDGPVKREDQVVVTGRDGWTYWATLTPEGELLFGEPVGVCQPVE